MKHLSVLVGVILGCAMAAQAGDSLVPIDPQPRPVRVEDMRPHPFRDEGYSEQWTIGLWDDNGRFFLGADALITNIGLGDGHGAFKVFIVETSGKEMQCAEEYSSDEWRVAESGFELQFGRNRLWGDENGLKVSSRCDKFSLELELKNVAPPVFPGSGTARFGKDGVYTMLFPSPRARAQGTLTIQGTSRPIEGWAFSEHSYANLASYKTTSRWFRFKLVDRNLSIILAEFESTPDYGSGRSGWAVVADSDGLVLATSRVRFEFEHFVEEKNDKGYPIPRQVRLVAADGDRRLLGTLVMTGLQKVVDPTAALGAVKRAVVRRFTKPRDYYLNCRYEFTIEKGGQKREFKGDGFYRFLHVNPR